MVERREALSSSHFLVKILLSSFTGSHHLLTKLQLQFTNLLRYHRFSNDRSPRVSPIDLAMIDRRIAIPDTIGCGTLSSSPLNFKACGTSGALYTLILWLTGCSCIYSCFYRSKMRTQYSLLESPCNDCLVHCCCEACALCQEYRELKRRGFDMRIGWHANMERQGRAAPVMMTPPTVEGGMSTD